MTLVAPLAHAADIGAQPFDPGPQQVEQPQELGTGWYLRGDVGFGRDALPKLSPDLNLISATTVKNAYNLGIGGGYKFNNWFRADATLDYFSNVKASGIGGSVQCPVSFTGPVFPSTVFTANNQACGVGSRNNVSRRVLLGNAYFDLGTWSSLTPYIGAGAGISQMNTTGGVYYLNPNGSPYASINNPNTGITPVYDKSIHARKYQLAWALMAGVTVEVAPHASLDVGYRYLNLGQSKGVSAVDGTTFSRAATEHQFRAGIRYMID